MGRVQAPHVHQVVVILIAIGAAALAGALLIDRHERRTDRARFRHNRKASHLRLLAELQRQP